MGTVKLHIAAIALIAMASLALSCGDMYSDLLDSTGCFRVIYIANGATAGTVPIDVICYRGIHQVTVLGNIGFLRGASIRDGICQRITQWNTEPGGGGTAYYPGNTFIINGKDVVLYAQWSTDGSVLGKIGPAGGYVFYDNGSYTGIPPWRYMEVSPKDLGGAPYGPLGSAYGLDTFASMQIGQGLPNTAIILAGCTQPNIAARLCEAYELNGYADWYLPSSNEIVQIHSNAYSVDEVRNFSGPWPRAYYWTSNEWNGGPTVGANAIIMNHGDPMGWDGYLEPGATKTDIMRVRAARRF